LTCGNFISIVPDKISLTQGRDDLIAPKLPGV